jgi:hypothetical protein
MFLSTLQRGSTARWPQPTAPLSMRNLVAVRHTGGVPHRKHLRTWAVIEDQRQGARSAVSSGFRNSGTPRSLALGQKPTGYPTVEHRVTRTAERVDREYRAAGPSGEIGGPGVDRGHAVVRTRDGRLSGVRPITGSIFPGPSVLKVQNSARPIRHTPPPPTASLVGHSEALLARLRSAPLEVAPPGGSGGSGVPVPGPPSSLREEKS